MKPKLHFHSLDALRFFAFFKVYLLHIPIVVGAFPVFAFLKQGGGIGVAFFFVLSGFLISYLLINEKLSRGTVNVKKFLIRRSLRIWPLYLLIISLLFFLPLDIKTLFLGYNQIGNGYDLDWRFSFFFLENYKMYLTDLHPKTTTISMFWSLCIEEHFYIFWVVMIFLIPKKWMLQFLISSVVLAIIARFVEPLIIQNQSIETNELFTNLDYFAIGGILGYYVAKDYDKVSNLILSLATWLRICIVVGVVLFVIFQREIFPYNYENIANVFRPTLIAILFSCLLAVFIPKNSTIKFSERNPLTYLGKISYGLYVYHGFVVVGLIKIFTHLNLFLNNWTNLSLFLLVSFALSVGFSSLSYHFFELPFLRLRERLTSKNV